MLSTDTLNTQWAFHIIDQLSQQGICHFWIAPGSRSTPLTLSIANHKKCKSMIHFDERGLAYHALGFSKACDLPVGIIVTSGTAVGNLLPALMEAWENRIPLMILSADRPPELKECSANQTTSQTNIFQSWTSWSGELVCPSHEIPTKYISSIIAYAYEKLQQGPVHLNCQFREPLFSKNLNIQPISTTTYHHAEQTIDKTSIQRISTVLNHTEKGLIILGELTREDISALYPLITKLKWPVYADILSNQRCLPTHKYILKNFPQLVKNRYDLFQDTNCVLQFGHNIVSKSVQHFIQKLKPISYFLISKISKKQDEFLLISDRICCSPAIFCKETLPYLKERPPFNFHTTLDNDLQNIVNNVLSNYPTLTEPFILAHLSKCLPKEHTVFFGNSMPIRDANAFFMPNNRPKSIYFNRGVSGIDGNIATCFGLAKASKMPLIAVMGDLTFLHDLNSLAFVKDISSKVIFIILNNQGGGIFSHLPVSQFQDHLKTFFTIEHEFSFKNAAQMFGLQYQCIKTKDSFTKLLPEYFPKKSHIIELRTQIKDNLAHHQKIDLACKEFLTNYAINSSLLER